MLPRPVCQRAARLKSSSEYIWISEEFTREVYRRYTATAKATKRHGSFMPGPMECRRRLGRRRMAYTSEQHLPTLVPSLSFLWRWLLKEPDNTQWTWEAPRVKMEAQSHVDIPEPVAALDAASSITACAPGPPAAVHWSLAEALGELRLIASSESNEQVWNALDRFIPSFGEHVALGRVSDSEVGDCLEIVAEMLGRDELRGERATQVCLSLYGNAWDACLACRSIAVGDRSEGLPKTFLWGLLNLPPSSLQQTMLSKIIASISSTRLIESLQPEISMLVDIWTNAWDRETDWTINEALLGSLMLNAENNVTNLASQIISLASSCRQSQYLACDQTSLITVRKSLQDAQKRFQTTLQSLGHIEDVINPERASVSALADLLELLPHKLTLNILRSCNAKKAVAVPTVSDHWKHHYWLCLLGDLAVVDEVSFAEMWKELKTSHLTIEPIFRHWTSRGLIQQPLLVKNTLEISSVHDTLNGADLIYAVSQHEGNYWPRVKSLFYMLERANRYLSVHRIIRRMARLDLRIPAADARAALETMSRHSSRKAIYLNNLQPRVIFGRRPVSLWRCPTFITALINDSRQTPRMIWELLRIRKELSPDVATILHPLIIEMIKAFAHSDRSRSSALRNVVSGVWWLQNNGFAITSDISTAVTHVGITRSIEAGNFIRAGKLAWILSIIEEAEGRDTAAEVETYVMQWNDRILRRRGMAR